jgi:hypothetical protein
VAVCRQTVPTPAPRDSLVTPLSEYVPPPDGYERVQASPASVGAWLRQIGVRRGRPPVYLHDGRKKANQSAPHAVLDVDVGSRDLQQPWSVSQHCSLWAIC